MEWEGGGGGGAGRHERPESKPSKAAGEAASHGNLESEKNMITYSDESMHIHPKQKRARACTPYVEKNINSVKNEWSLLATETQHDQ